MSALKKFVTDDGEHAGVVNPDFKDHYVERFGVNVNYEEKMKIVVKGFNDAISSWCDSGRNIFLLDDETTAAFIETELPDEIIPQYPFDYFQIRIPRGWCLLKVRDGAPVNTNNILVSSDRGRMICSCYEGIVAGDIAKRDNVKCPI